MRYVVTAEEMRRYDTNTIEQIGIPGAVLMERAALAVRERILAVWDEMQCASGFKRSRRASVLILAGVGNNGGDGLALARLLTECGMLVELWCIGDTSKASAGWLAQRKILEAYDVRVSDKPASLEYTILVDALFGVGLSREVSGVYKNAIELFDKLEGYKLAVDVPSGICSDTGQVLGCAVSADETITFAYAKRGLYLYPGCEHAGVVHVADIGINERSFGGKTPAMFCLKDDWASWLPGRNSAGNKGTFGKVLLVAGSEGMAGAAILAAKAAYRVGAGMVKVITDQSNRVVLQESIPEAMFGNYDALNEALLWADIVAVGPGIGKSKQAFDAMETVICHSKKPLLIDADGLNILAEQKALFAALSGQKDRQVVITPHVGELSRLSGYSISELKHGLWQYAIGLAEQLHAVVVAKDARSFVCAKGQPVCMNICGNDGMATAGSGDVLVGMIAGLWGQYQPTDATDAQQNAFYAACAGVYLHGMAGDVVAAGKGRQGLMAGDLPEAAAQILKCPQVEWK